MGIEISTPGVDISGEVAGPSSATDNAIARFDGTTGKLIQNSSATLADTGIISATAFAVDSLQIDATEFTFGNQNFRLIPGSGVASALEIVGNNTTQAYRSMLEIQPNKESNVGLIIQPYSGLGTQTADLQQWNDKTGTPLSWIAADGTPGGLLNTMGTFKENDTYSSYAFGTTPIIYIPVGSGMASFGTGDGTLTTDASGAVNIFTGSNGTTSTTASSGAITVQSGFVDGTTSTGNSGALYFASGGVTGGASGFVHIESGSSTTGQSGALTLNTSSAAGGSGPVTIQSGNASAGNSGSIAVKTGTASGTRGIVSVQANDTKFNDAQNIKLTSSSANWWTGGSNPALEFLTDGSTTYVIDSSNAVTDIATSPLVIVTGSNTLASSTASTGELDMVTGAITNADASGATGSMQIYTGDNSGSGQSGGITIATGLSTTTTGSMNFFTGAGDVSGDINVITSNATTASGNIVLHTGTGTTRGYIHFNSLVAVLPTGTSDPSTGYPDGSSYYNTSTNKIMVLNGGTWRGITLT